VELINAWNLVPVFAIACLAAVVKLKLLAMFTGNRGCSGSFFCRFARFFSPMPLTSIWWMNDWRRFHEPFLRLDLARGFVIAGPFFTCRPISSQS